MTTVSQKYRSIDLPLHPYEVAVLFINLLLDN